MKRQWPVTMRGAVRRAVTMALLLWFVAGLPPVGDMGTLRAVGVGATQAQAAPARKRTVAKRTSRRSRRSRASRRTRASRRNRGKKKPVRLARRRAWRWINHYLEPDRRRITGGIWKFVSTETDTRFHRANAVEMMRQDPGKTIGFADAKLALEAGYIPGRTIHPDDLFPRIKLGDDRSSIVLPDGWAVVTSDEVPSPPGATPEQDSLAFTATIMAYRNNPQMAMAIMTFIAPRRLNPQRDLTAKVVRQNLIKAIKKNKNNDAVKQLQLDTRIFDIKLGGLPGHIQFNNTPGDVGSTVSIQAGRGQKVYWFQMTKEAYRAPLLNVIVNSFRPG